jgi:hypothetical protein
MVLLFGMLVIQTVRVGFGIAPVVLDVLATMSSVAIFITAFDAGMQRKIGAVVFASLVAVSWSRYAVPASTLDLSLAYHVLSVVFSFFAMGVILRDLLRFKEPGVDNVAGAICGYLLGGNAWASANIITYLLTPLAYRIDPDVVTLLTDWHGRTAIFSYYTFTQVITIGYSDVTPVRPPATTLSLLSALFGVFYTAVVVSQLLSIAQAGKSRSP